jgi:hypothetical protein
MNDIELLGTKLDKAAATLLVSDKGDRHLLAETVLAGIALFLLKKYADGFLKGLGLEDLAKKHGEKTVEFLRRLRAGPDAHETETARQDLDVTLEEVRAHAPTDRARAIALEVTVQIYLDAGAVRSQAEREALKVAAAADRLLAP